MKNSEVVILFVVFGGMFLLAAGAAVWLYLDSEQSTLPAALQEGADEDPLEVDVTLQQMDVVKRTLSKDSFIDIAIQRFQLRMGRYPASIDELVNEPRVLVEGEKWGGPYIRNTRLLSDPWGRPFEYTSPGRHNAASYDIWSLGADGISGTNDDIGNW